MKNNCDMARDLMPLTIDGVASEASQTYVNEHLEECEACRAYLAGMKASLQMDSRQAAQERRSFGETAARMRRRRVMRKLLTAVIIFAAATAALYMAVYMHSAYNTTPVALAPGEYSVQLSQLKDGRVIMTANTYGKRIVNLFVTDRSDGNGGRIARVTLVSTRGSSGWMDEMGIIELPSVQGYQAVEYGEDRPATLWMRGEAIEPASAEMEAYYKALGELEAFDREVEKRHVIEMAEKGDYGETYQLTPEEAARRYDLAEALRAAKDRVPEWISGNKGRFATPTPGPMG